MTAVIDMSRVEVLFQLAMKDGRRERVHEGGRERSGTYFAGFKNDTLKVTLERDDCIVQSTQVDWQQFTLAADQRGTRFALTIHKGGHVVFDAKREGAMKKDRFGAGERFVGTTNTPAGEWVVTVGELPEELLV